MINSELLGEILRARCSLLPAAGLAVADIDPRVSAAWLPLDTPHEPQFLVYSVTKTFTAALVMQAQERGNLQLDDPLAKWAPDAGPAKRVTLRQLMNHTSGIRDYGELAVYHDEIRTSPLSPWSRDRFLRETVGRGLKFDPGSAWVYSNPGYMLLKEVLEKATDRSFRELVHERIAAPLGLGRTLVAESGDDLASLAPGPSESLSVDRRSFDMRDRYHPGWVCHGVVASTPTDTARFLSSLFRGEIVSHRSLDAMTDATRTPGGPPQWPTPSYGLGLMGDPNSRWGSMWGHGGAGPGYGAAVFHVSQAPGPGLSVCAMCSTEDQTLPWELVFGLLDRKLSHHPPAERELAPDGPLRGAQVK